jgi:DNA-directed RNA polymerase subunit M/transcription elongation factor TFIIS
LELKGEVATMDRASRCPNCGKHLVPTSSDSGRTELKCVFCDHLDPMELQTARRWADSSLAEPNRETAH